MAVHRDLLETRPAVSDATQIAPLAVGGADAARLLSISERLLQEMATSGEIPSFKIGGRRLYRVAALDAWLKEREEAENGSVTELFQKSESN